MIYMQKLPYSETNLIVKGDAYRFDSSGIYRGIRGFRYINLIPVQVVSYLTQGAFSEKVDIDEHGDVLTRVSIPTGGLIAEIQREKASDNCLGVLIKNIIFKNVSSTQYIVLYRK